MISFIRCKLFILLLYPAVVGYTPPKGESETWLDFVTGIGSLVKVSRDCYGNTTVNRYQYKEASAAIRLKKESVVTTMNVGLFTSTGPYFFESRSGERMSSSPYLGALVGYEGHSFGIEVGAFSFLNKPERASTINPSLALRIGAEEKGAFWLNYFNSNTAMISGTVFDLGASRKFSNKTSSIHISRAYFGTGVDFTGSLKLTTRLQISNAEETNIFSVGVAVGSQDRHYCGSGSIGYSFRL